MMRQQQQQRFSRRRHILPPEQLARYNATPIHYNNNEEEESKITIGIQIGKWKITTSNSSIAGEADMEKLSDYLQGIVDAGPPHEDSEKKKNTNETTTITNPTSSPKKYRRRICPPEVAFLGAFVSLSTSPTTNNTIEENKEVSSMEIKFDAKDALSEWAEAHVHLPTPSSSFDTVSNTAAAVVPSSYRGVEILQTIDAKLWSSRKKDDHNNNQLHSKSHQQQQQLALQNQKWGLTSSSSGGSTNDTTLAAAAASTEFYFDWSYSTPYASTVTLTPPLLTDTSPTPLGKSYWKTQSNSTISIKLLTDQTQPILYFDDVTLYEDDLHDNGDVSLNIKIRVMPTCFFVKQRLFVRVDYVIVKVKEVRIFYEFGSGGRVVRDITWRECKWKDLSELGLPTDVRSWREDGGVGGNVNGRI
uniref:TIP41-like protein n=1 Tax=Ditylum brightwellii TaxID=49249 RepID=A0A7S4QTK6_9STRA